MDSTRETGQPRATSQERHLHEQSPPPAEREPAAEKMDERPSPTAQKVEGKVEELGGRARQVGGAITGDAGTRVRGQGQEIKGKVKQKIADWRSKLRKKV